MSEEKVRVHIEIDRELHNRMSKAIPWGMRQLLIRKLLEKIVTAVEEHGEIILGAIISDEYELTEVQRLKNTNKE